MGHPKYEVTEGTVTLDGEDVLEMAVDERARAGFSWLCSIQVKLQALRMPTFCVVRLMLRRGEGNEISLIKFIRQMEEKMKSWKWTLSSCTVI